MKRNKTFTALFILFTGILNYALAQEAYISKFDAPFRVAAYQGIRDEHIFDIFDERCLDVTGHKTSINKSDAVTYFDDYMLPVRIYDLSYLRCKGWANEWELGVISMGSGGNEWAVVIGEQFIVRVRAMRLLVQEINLNELLLLAYVHPVHCESSAVDCIKEFKFNKP